jgi:hypothetical protein
MEETFKKTTYKGRVYEGKEAFMIQEDKGDKIAIREPGAFVSGSLADYDGQEVEIEITISIKKVKTPVTKPSPTPRPPVSPPPPDRLIKEGQQPIKPKGWKF